MSLALVAAFTAKITGNFSVNNISRPCPPFTG